MNECLRQLIDFVQDIANNWDCDLDAHAHGTLCRKCEAERVLKEIKNG